MVAQADQAS
jgi:hypothetical protein